MTASTGRESICKNNGNNDTKALQHYFFTPANNGQKEQEANPFLNTSFWQMGRVLWSIHVKKQQHISQTSSLWVIATSTSDQPTSKLHPVSQAWAKKVHVDFLLILYPNVPVYPRELRAFFFFYIQTIKGDKDKSNSPNKGIGVSLSGKTRAGRYPGTILSGAKARHYVFINTCSKM